MGQLVFQAALGGQVNLVGPNTASTFNLNVPAVSSTLATLAAQTFSGTQTMTTLTSPAATALTLQSAGTTAVTVDTSQNVLVGSASNPFNSKLYVTGTPTANAPIASFYSQGNSSTSGIGLYNDSASVGIWSSSGNLTFRTNGNLASGAETMRIDSSGNVGIGESASIVRKLCITASGTTATTRAGIQLKNEVGTTAEIYQGPTSNNALIFEENGSERMRIDSSGNLLVGRTSGNSDARFTPDGGSTNSSSCIDFSKGSATTTTAQVYARFWCNNLGTATGSITANGVSSATFTGYSDRRLKENIVDLPSQLANIMALRPVEFDFKGYENGEGHQIGFIAQDVQLVYPDLVGEGDSGMLTLSDMNKNDARLIKCIQEQQALIQSLTTRITALEQK